MLKLGHYKKIVPFSLAGGIGEVKQVSLGLVLSTILHRLKLLQTSFLVECQDNFDVGMMEYIYR
jgi:hypothetical protein